MNPITIIASILGGYFVGSISPSYLCYRMMRGGDIREVGDGNPGAVNISIQLGKIPGLVVAFLDLCKGIIPIFAARAFGISDRDLIPVGIATVIGHDWPIFLRFRGGKGAMTSIGVLLVYLPVMTLLALSLWAFIHYGLKIRFIGALTAFSIIPILSYLSCTLLGDPLYYPLLPLGILALFLVRMRENIRRYLGAK